MYAGVRGRVDGQERVHGDLCTCHLGKRETCQVCLQNGAFHVLEYEGRAFFFFLLVLSMAFGCVLVSAFVFWYSRRFSFIENFELHVLKL